MGKVMLFPTHDEEIATQKKKIISGHKAVK